MNETTQQEKTTQLSSRNEQLNSAAETKQLNSSVGTKQLNSALPSTAYNRLQPPAPPAPPATACTAFTAESAFSTYLCVLIRNHNRCLQRQKHHLQLEILHLVCNPR
ncbi:hypothetical protein TNCV_2906101 [Trichonephila clavipes]|nr:hypothetical protein TNCV_2906101 [Trichonephila clavipes]